MPRPAAGRPARWRRPLEPALRGNSPSRLARVVGVRVTRKPLTRGVPPHDEMFAALHSRRGDAGGDPRRGPVPRAGPGPRPVLRCARGGDPAVARQHLQGAQRRPGVPIPGHGNLRTCRAGAAAQHHAHGARGGGLAPGKGWETFTDQVICGRRQAAHGGVHLVAATPAEAALLDTSRRRSSSRRTRHRCLRTTAFGSRPLRTNARVDAGLTPTGASHPRRARLSPTPPVLVRISSGRTTRPGSVPAGAVPPSSSRSRRAHRRAPASGSLHDDDTLLSTPAKRAAQHHGTPPADFDPNDPTPTISSAARAGRSRLRRRSPGTRPADPAEKGADRSCAHR